VEIQVADVTETKEMPKGIDDSMPFLLMIMLLKRNDGGVNND